MSMQLRCGCHSPADAFFQERARKLSKKQTMLAKKTATAVPVSVMYNGGTIRTIKGGATDKVVEAIGFHDGKVAAVGSSQHVAEQMSKLTGGSYENVKLSQQQALYPGFIEPHCHTGACIMLGGMIDFSPFSGQYLREKYDAEWFAEQIQEGKKNLKEGYWIIGHSSDTSLMPYTINDEGLNELQNLDVDAVDKMESEVPVLVMTTGHSAYVNTPTLKIVYDKIQPEGFDTFESFREFVNEGRGLNEIPQLFPALSCIPTDQIKEISESSAAGFDIIFATLCQRGVTTLNDAGMTQYTLDLLNDYFAVGNPQKVRIGYAMIINTIDECNALKKYKPLTGELPSIFQATCKLVPDGSNQCLTGYQKEPYCCLPENNTGINNIKLPVLQEMIKIIAKDKQWPLLVHSNGNAQIEETLTAYEGALKGESGLQKRHRIEHCSLLSDESLNKMARLGISPSFLIGHATFWGDVFKNAIFGESRVQTLLRCQSALQRGIRISLHSDFWVTPFGPLRKMEQAVTRIMERDPDGKVLNHDEKLTPAQALRAVTYDAAWQCQIDKYVGSLEVGKIADYVILGEDPLTRKDPIGMREIPVLETWMGGVKRGSLTFQ